MVKKQATKKHMVKANLQVVELTKSGTSLNLQIYADQQKIGELVVGRGSLYWYGRKRQRRKRIDWTKFAKKMDELAYGN